MIFHIFICKVDNVVYKIHPKFNLYGASEDGKIIYVIKQVPINGTQHKSGYMICGVR